MRHDPLYREIVKRLDEQLDPLAFQDCANALLMDIFPTLAPMQGGDDEGMDGAIADLDADASPVIATTDKRTIRNLRNSLLSRIASGSSNRKAVLATSRALSNDKKRNLHKEAEKHGFQLLNIYDQLWFAMKLYLDSVWRKQLLGLTGNPPALSAVPISVSNSAIHDLVGRQGDLDALMCQSGDRIVVGQPGSGKSFLLGHLSLEGKALFVVSNDRTAIADGIRAFERTPPLLVVDDVQTEEQMCRLRTVMQIRNDLHAEFNLVAASWPGSSVEIAQETLGIGEEATLELTELTIDEIVAILSQLGLTGPRWVIADIVNQAEGWPGLAVTLGTACLFGNWSGVFSGQQLADYVLKHVEHSSSERAKFMLAAFALGGNSGMPISLVADALEMSQVDVIQLLSVLDSSGVIREAGANISVHPYQLRCGLIRSTFYSGARVLDPLPLIVHTPNQYATAEALIGAAARGAPIDAGLLRALIQGCNHDSVYQDYAWLGSAEARWVLSVVPSRLQSMARPCLRRAPETCIPLLLEKAIGDDRELNAALNHPLRVIQDWIGEATPHSGAAVQRRRILLDAVFAFAKEGNADIERTCMRVLPIALTPRFGRHFMEVSSELRAVYQFGYISAEEISELHENWPAALEFITGLSFPDWNAVLEILQSWGRPVSMRQELTHETKTLLQSYARIMLTDLVPIAQEHPAVARKLGLIANHLDTEIEVTVDPEFEVLFPERSLQDPADWRDAERRQAERVRALAQEYVSAGPSQAMERLAVAEQQSSLVKHIWLRWTPFAAQVIAEQVDQPLIWLQAAVDRKLAEDIASPLLLRSIELRSDGWEEVVSNLIENPSYCDLALSATLEDEDIPNFLFEKALVHLEGHEHLVQLASIRGEIPIARLSRLLQDDAPAISIAATEGEWLSDPRGEVRQELKPEWEKALIAHGRNQYWLSDALKSIPDLAFRWLERRIEDDINGSWRINEQIEAAASVLTQEQKKGLIHALPNSYHACTIADLLVSDDVELYETLLQSDLTALHLVPIGCRPNSSWRVKVLVALGFGYSPTELAQATYHLRDDVAVWTGDRSAMWQEWIEAFETFVDDVHDGIRSVCEEGRAIAESKRDRVLKIERQHKVTG